MNIDIGFVARRRRIVLFFCAAAVVAIAAAVMRPVGYLGGGADDEQYLAAARCWVAHGAPCLPTSHWWTRWPAIAPVAAFVTLLGESRFSVQLGPAIWWAMALVMTGWLANAWFGWRSGAAAVALIGSTPAFAFAAFDPNIDIPELALQLLALAAATLAYRRQSALMASLSGVFAAAAVQARETSLLFVGASALIWLTLPSANRKFLAWAALGFASAELLELLSYALCTGDPVLPLQLALAHTEIPTDQLPDGFRSNRGPILNPDFIRSWKRESHVTLWWPIDPWLNLYASALSGVMLATSTIGLLILHPRLPAEQRRGVGRLLLGASIIALGLVYLLAVDPKPRMFMSVYAALCISSGVVIARALRGETRLLAIVLGIVPISAGLVVMSHCSTSARGEAWARKWIERYGQDIEISRGAASYLTFLPETRTLSPSGAGRRYLLTIAAVDCDKLIDPHHREGILVDQYSSLGRLCLFEYWPIRLSVAKKTPRM